MKKVIVTGMSGMVGTRLQQLLSTTYEFENMDITAGVDITDYEKVKQFLSTSRAKVVLHLAAFTNVSAAHEQDGDKHGSCYQVNVVGTENIARACKQHDKYLIHVSTDYVFDGKKQEPYAEVDQPQPIEWYGQTKLWAEEVVGRELANFAILRIAYPYQAFPSRPDFLASMKEKLLAGTLPPAFADHIITPVFVDDLVKVFEYCVENRPSGIFHAVGSSWHSDYEIAQIVSQAFDIDGEIQRGSLEEYLKTATRPYQKTMKVSNAKLVAEFGIGMKSLNQGLEEIKRQMTE